MTYMTNLTDAHDLKLFGGKAVNLERLMKAGFNIPDGFVISTDAYIELINTNVVDKVISDSLSEIDYSSQESINTAGETIRDAITSCKLPEIVRLEISHTIPPEKIFAVRSSATAEDLPSASFAGLQDTYLNVIPEDIPTVVKKCFASLWTARAIVYRHEQNIDHTDVKMSVIIQGMVDADSSGVVFTINPTNNDYDEMVINSTRGLGDKLVSGEITPDSIIYDKYNHYVIKQTSGNKNSMSSLADDQISRLASICTHIEDEYDTPMDIEWAIKNSRIYILQARPITTWIPIPEEMQTSPDEPRILYLDFMITRQGITENFSVLGIDFFNYIQRPFTRDIFGADTDGIKDGLTFYSHGRGYINLSNMYSIFGERFFNQWERVADSKTLRLMKDTLPKYKIKKRPRKLRFTGFLTLTKFVFSPRLSAYYRAYNRPDQYLEETKQKEGWFVDQLKEAISNYHTLHQLSERIGELYSEFVSQSLMVTYAAEKARVALDGIFADNPELRRSVNKLERSLPGNITIEMGLDMYELSQFPDINEIESFSDFNDRLKKGDVSEIFLNKWNKFIARFGMRSPMELDMKRVRPGEDISILFRQLKQYSILKESPIETYQKSVRQRKKAADQLLKIARSAGKEKTFIKNYDVLVKLGGYRETHKYYIVLAIYMMKNEILKVAQRFVDEGRLETVDQIFDLKVQQIDDALQDNSLDMIQLGRKNTEHIRKTDHVKYFPTVIDSRGRIPTISVSGDDKNQLVGESVSAGTARGRVKVLHYPDEKPIEPGDILVARTTDPGWTPLFINAQAVVLEIGGMLQHGALVAREYGKPCVAGIVDVTSKLKDGQLVEVDGGNGVVIILDENS